MLSVFLWDIFLDNEKDTTSFTDNKISIYNSALFLYSDGYLSFIRELLSTIQCPMDLREYPHDIQHCKLSFMSFTYNILQLNFTQSVLCGRFEPCDKVSIVESSAFKMLSANSSVRAMDYGVMVPNSVVDVVLQRQLPYYLYQVNHNHFVFFIFHGTATSATQIVIVLAGAQSCAHLTPCQVFIPTLLVVMCSWLIFWIDLGMGDQVIFCCSLCSGLVASNFWPKTSVEFWNCRLHLECC